MSPPATTTRWCPTAEQLMILEEMYRGGMRTPGAALIQKITAHLSKYGRVEGKNVFYWFQNHKARDRQRLRRKITKNHHHHHHYNNSRHLLHYLRSLPPPPPPPSSSSFFAPQHLPFYDATSFPHHPQVRVVGRHNVEEESSSMIKNKHVEASCGDGREDDRTVEMRRYKQKQADLMMMAIQEMPCSATVRPTETLVLFPLTATDLKEECQ